MMDKTTRYLIVSLCLMVLAGCGKGTDTDPNAETLQVEIETLDTSTEEQVAEEPEEAIVVHEEVIAKENGIPITVAVASNTAADILVKANKALDGTDYYFDIVKCDNYSTPNDMVKNGEALACLSDNQVYLESYNKINETNLTTAKRVYYDPLAVFPGTIEDINRLPNGFTVAVNEGSVNVARALYLLEQKGILEVKEEAKYQASIEDVTNNPYNVKLEEVDFSAGWPDTTKYGLVIADYNRAILNGIDPESSFGEENRNSKILDMFTVNIVISPDKAEDPNLQVLMDALDSEIVTEYIENSSFKSVQSY